MAAVEYVQVQPEQRHALDCRARTDGLLMSAIRLGTAVVLGTAEEAPALACGAAWDGAEWACCWMLPFLGGLAAAAQETSCKCAVAAVKEEARQSEASTNSPAGAAAVIVQWGA